MPKTADLLEEIAALKALLIAADARDKRKDERAVSQSFWFFDDL